MLFVVFPDASASETPQQLVNLLVPLAQQWYSDVSYGRVSLSVTPIAEIVQNVEVL